MTGNTEQGSNASNKRWRRYWYLLVGLYVGAVLCSVYIRHNLAADYEQSLAQSQVWSQKFRQYARLGRLMTGVEGLDSAVYSQEQMAKAAAQFKEIHDEFDQVFVEEKRSLPRASQKAEAEMMLKDLELLKRGMDDLIRNTNQLLSELPAKGPSKPEALPQVADSFHKVLKTFGRLRSRIGGVEEKYFQQQIQAVHMLETVEYVIAFLLFILVGGVSYYGNRLEWQASRDLKEKALLLTQVEAADGKFRALFENASEGIFQLDSQGQFLIVNPALARMCGYSSPAEFMEAIQDVGTQFYADPLFWVQFLHDVKLNRALSTWEIEVQCRDGKRIWAEQNLHAVEAAPGEIGYFEGTLKNITEQKWAEVGRTFEYLLPRILAESASIAEAMGGVLQTVCEILDWEMGSAWRLSTRGDKLTLTHLHPATKLQRPSEELLGSEVAAAEGFLADIRNAGEIVWFDNHSDESPDIQEASAKGLHMMVSLPVKVNGKAGELLNFFCSQSGQPTPELHQLLDGLAHQLGALFERKLSEEALRESEALKVAIFEASLDSMITFDEDGLITEFNPAAERTFGYPREKAIGLKLSRIIAPSSLRGSAADFSSDDRPRFATASRNQAGPVSAGNPAQMLGQLLEVTGITRDGVEIPVEMSISEIVHNGRKFFTAYVRDIGERKRAERVRLELAAVVESSSDAIIGLSPEGNILSWNSGAMKMFGYTAQEVAGRHVYLLVPPDRIEESTRNLQALRRGKHLANHATVRLRKGGERFDVALTESPIRNSSGAISGISLIARDITETKQLQEQFLQSQKMEAIGALAGGIAHDFNNILTAIIGYSDLTLRQIGEGAPFHKNIMGIKSSAEFAASLTHQLLAFSRRQTLELSVFPVNDSVTRIQKLLHRLIGENINIITSLSESAGRIKADRGQMEQVIMNLAVNARDAMPKGGVLTLETSNVRVDAPDAPAGLEEGYYVKLSVSDTGHGMSDEVREHLFEPFFTTKEKGKGTGLGLATCYGIIKQIGGHIFVESTLGEGSSFHLYFPRVADTEESSKFATKKIGVLPMGTETILLVEDEETVRQLSADVLRRLGYLVLEAAESDTARAIIEERKGEIDLLLSDVVLPNTSGKELAAWASTAYPEIKVLLMSGYLEDSMLKNHGISPEDAFLQKPFSPGTLAEKVRQVINSPARARA